eukprot:gene1120-54_t
MGDAGDSPPSDKSASSWEDAPHVLEDGSGAGLLSVDEPADATTIRLSSSSTWWDGMAWTRGGTDADADCNLVTAAQDENLFSGAPLTVVKDGLSTLAQAQIVCAPGPEPSADSSGNSWHATPTGPATRPSAADSSLTDPHIKSPELTSNKKTGVSTASAPAVSAEKRALQNSTADCQTGPDFQAESNKQGKFRPVAESPGGQQQSYLQQPNPLASANPLWVSSRPLQPIYNVNGHPIFTSSPTSVPSTWVPLTPLQFSWKTLWTDQPPDLHTIRSAVYCDSSSKLRPSGIIHPSTRPSSPPTSAAAPPSSSSIASSFKPALAAFFPWCFEPPGAFVIPRVEPTP